MNSAPTRVPTQATDLLAPRFHIVLSPHYDDLALSIGATMATLAAAGREVLDLIVFGTEPVGIALHAFARHHHEAWGVSASEAIATRRREEAAAVSILGASTGNLPFHDAIYRGDYYTSDEALFGTPSEAESGLPQAIALAAAEVATALAGPDHRPDNANARFYAPLAIGRHVDHLLAFQAGRLLGDLGYVVWFYEDLPYAMIGDNLADRLAEITRSGLTVEPVADVPADPGWQRKLDAVLAYPSQLETVFTNYAGVDASAAAIDAALSGYHREIGNGQRAERFWRVAGP